ISRPGAAALDDAALASARDILPEAPAPLWLEPAHAADVLFTPPAVANEISDDRAWAERLRGVLAGRPIDPGVQPRAGRRKLLLIADMDSTIIGQECIDELADRVGLKAQVAAITERAMRGDTAFEPALRERVGLLKGLPESVIDEVMAERIRVTPGAKT